MIWSRTKQKTLFQLTIAVTLGAAIAGLPVFAKDSRFFKRVAFLRNHRYQKRLATPLQDGRILFFGGYSWRSQANRYSESFSKVEIFDPRTDAIQEIEDSPFDLCLKDAQSVTLPSNEVLIWGSDITHDKNRVEVSPRCECSCRFSAKDDIERCQKATGLLYDPEKREYRSLFNIRPVRTGATATVLSDGKVIFVGGKLSSKERFLQRMEGRRPALPKSIIDIRNDTERRSAIQSVDPETDADRRLYQQIQMYDPQRDEIHTIGHLTANMILTGHTTTDVGPDRLVIIGGVNEISTAESETPRKTSGVLRSIFLYNIKDNSFQEIGELTFARELHTVIPLVDERLLVVGGDRHLELFDLKNRKNQVIGMFEPEASGQLTAAKLPSGQVLLVAGYRRGHGEAGFFGDDHAESDVALLDTQTWKIRRVDSLIPGWADCAAITNQDGRIFLFGGTARAFINFSRNSDGGQYSRIEAFDYGAFKKQYEQKR